MISKSEFRGLVSNLIDDPDNQRWSTTALDTLIELTLDSLFGDLLLFQPWLVSAVSTGTQDAQGRVNLQKTSAGGILGQRFFRVQQVWVGTEAYGKGDPRTSLPEVEEGGYGTYWVSNGYLYTYPAGGETVNIRYSYFPERFTQQSNSALVQWPDGFEGAAVFEVAGRAISKGAAEDSNTFLTLAMKDLNTLKAVIQTRDINPPQVGNTENSWGWGF